MKMVYGHGFHVFCHLKLNHELWKKHQIHVINLQIATLIQLYIVKPQTLYVVRHNAHSVLECSTIGQGLTLRFQARGPKRPIGKSRGQKTVFFAIKLTFLGPYSEKSRGPQQILGAYAPWPLGKSNPVGGTPLSLVSVPSY